MEIRKVLTKLSEKWPAKVLSIALALALFVFHRMSTLEERFFSAPLRVELEPHIVPASLYPQMIRLSVRGDAASVRSLVEEDIEPYIDLKGRGRGSYRTPILFRKKGTALGVEPLEIRLDPLEVTITLDNKISKYVPVRANIQGAVKQGYELIGTSLNPEQVILDGPAEIMSEIAELSTEVVELDGRNDGFSTKVGILNPNPLVNIRGTAITEFQGTVTQILGLGNFNGLPITVRGLSGRLLAAPAVKTGMVRLEGSQKELETYAPGADFLFVDCAGITEAGTYTLPVRADLPAGFTALRIEPEQVVVQVRSGE
ncbi:MAG: hypothetical protein LBD24_00245 [Spirochaetaceae bacterium]|nr:hypothetical protein [Spirochaetaceae bacterium]